MKRILNLTGIAILFLFLAACNQSSQRTDLDAVRDDFRDALSQIEEALTIQEFDDFKGKAENAIGSIDSAVDDYLSEMDNNDMRIDQQTRNSVISMKQKRAEVDLKLSLLDHEVSDDRWETTDSRETTYGRTDGTTRSGSIDTTNDRDMYDRTTVDTRTTTADRGWNEDDDARESLYGRNLQEEIRNDLQELHNEVQQFMQASLDYQLELE